MDATPVGGAQNLRQNRQDIFPLVYPIARRAVRVRSAGVRRSGLPVYDRNDFEQEALLAVWCALPRFDPARASLRTFLERVVANRMHSLVRSLRSACRDYTKVEGLDGRAVWLHGPSDRFDLRIDVRRVLAGVSEFDRAVAVLLIGHSAIETSRRLCASRAAVYRAIVRLRAAFTAAGLSP